MQTQDLIIAICSASALLLTGYYVRKLLLQVFDRHYAAGILNQKMEHAGRFAALNADIATLTQLRKHEAQQLADLRNQLRNVKVTPFTSSDFNDLMDITRFLTLALQTWKALQGTESTQARAEQLIKLSRAMSYRVFHTVESAANLNAQSLDTQLIEWLNKSGDLYPDIEQSAISFPHVADTEGYAHLRDALREAFEQDKARQTEELDITHQPGAAA
ncbi:hypothetical protein [Pseudomonas sp. B28(2017)]|uniref:hypothetical protein n=1 Tax=Pseudomonas sp. B28(2017) TaxID=1981730 RepID=UPI000A1EDC7C|nr:hypothetical protein [Pseudomonas sp. B28(2017)]